MHQDLVAFRALVYKNLKTIFDVEGNGAYAAWLGIIEIWQNDWWNRAWIIQEGTVKEHLVTLTLHGVTLYKRTPKVQFWCGQHPTTWDCLTYCSAVAGVLLTMPLLSASTSILRGVTQNFTRVSSVRAHRLMEQVPELLEQLQLTRVFECSDPRDKVYASLSLIPRHVAEMIQPMYEMSPQDVYLDIARIELQQSKSLDFLGHTIKLDEPRRTPSRNISWSSFPSWLPNWDDPLRVYSLPRKLYNDTKRVIWAVAMGQRDVIGKSYNADRGEECNASILDYDFYVEGAIIDTVVDRYSYQQGTADDKQTQLNHWSTQQDHKYSNGESFNKALLSVQVADVAYSASALPVTRGNSANNQLLNARQADLTSEEEKAQDKMRLCINYATSFRGRCLTSRGYLGLVPWSARKGDHICVLLGGQVLYVLRSSPDTSGRYQYIGECCVYAMM